MAGYKKLSYKTTKDIPIPKKLIDNIIGQEKAINVIKKAAQQRRHVLLVGEPGTGKSMLGVALAQMLPKEKLKDILSFANANDENQPFIRVMPAGQGREWVAKVRQESNASMRGQSIVMFIIFFIISLIPWWLWHSGYWSDAIYGPSIIATMILFIGLVLVMNLNKRASAGNKISVPKVVVDNTNKEQAPFFDATGSHAGALLGDVLHDPFQSGGLGTPAHERVMGGMIHKANQGVLFVDEIATLAMTTQQELLTAIQEGKFSITGQSERSAGAMVRTEPVPCSFILVAAGNFDSVAKMHPALRSRIRGYGYEVYMKETMPDIPENRDKLAVFVAQEVTKDGKIPHFTQAAVDIIIEESRRRANRKAHLTLRLRELGGLVRAAGDYAKEHGSKVTDAKHIQAVRRTALTLEKQLSDRIIEHKKEYEVLRTTGTLVGRVNGLAVIGGDSSYSGMVLPIESEITRASKHDQTRITATGKLGEIAKEAIINVGAIIKKLFDKNLDEHAVFVQFLQTYEGVEGDSASIAVAVSIISALNNVPIRQDTAMTGSLSVRGTVLPIGGVSYKIEAAIEAGIKQVIIPDSNLQDVVISKEHLKKIKIIPVTDLVQVLQHCLDLRKNKSLLAKLKKK
ncbi:MAG: Lon-like ATP-dependent protease [Candidatus Woesearchaeota archaeon]|jgi:Lon-like ATP-dependent protease